MRLNACVLVLLLVGSSVAVAADRKANKVDFLTELVAMRALVRADEIGGYEAFHLAVTRAAGRPHGIKEESEHFESGGGRLAYDDAVTDWEALARDGDPNAMSNLAVMYDRGLGVAPDPARAVELYRAAADRGSVVAQNNLGIAYALGRGVGRDRAQAIQCEAKADDRRFEGWFWDTAVAAAKGWPPVPT